MKYSMLCIMLLAASPLTAQNQSKTMNDGCRPIPIGGGVSIWPERECEAPPPNLRRLIQEQKANAFIRVPSNCQVVEYKQKTKGRNEATITLKCVRPILLRDDYGRPRIK